MAIEQTLSPRLERSPSPETRQEHSVASAPEVAPAIERSVAPTPTLSTPVVLPTATVPERYRQIEQILEEDLAEIYFKMLPAEQQQFKRAGEQTTLAINALLEKPKINVRKIILLIRAWLQLIPGVNQFFLEQAAKIKADKVIAAASRDRNV